MSIHFMNFSNPASTISFCEKRLDSKLANEEMKKHEADCLSLEKRGPYLEKARRGDYNDVLAGIWKDKTNRLEFVRSLSGELHAPIMFEAVILEFTANPTAQTVLEVCFPLLSAAVFRASQDAMCSADSPVSSGVSVHQISNTYKTSLTNRVTKELKDPTSALFNKYTSIKAIVHEDESSSDLKMNEKTLEVANASKNTNLPPPDWMGQHGMNVFMRQLDPTVQLMQPSSEHKRLRDNYANLIIQSLNPHN